MTSLFSPSTPKVPDPAPAPAPPSTSDAAAVADDTADRLRRRRGTASTILAGDTATVPTGSTATKVLLGQ